MDDKTKPSPGLAEKKPSPKLDLLTWAGFTAAYFIAHQIAFFFPDSEQVIMAVWPAGGIGLAAFLLCPYRLWPWLFLSFYIGGIGADVLLNQRSLWAGVGYMTGNMVESLGCAWLILQWCGRDVRFTRVKEVLALIAGAVLVNAFSTCIGAGTAVLSRGVSFRDLWIGWYIADGLGILLITPLMVTVARIRDWIPHIRKEQMAEAFIFVALWVTVGWFSFQPEYISKPLAPHYYILVAVLAWPALRLGPQTVSLSLVLLAVIAITSRAVSEGPSPCGGDNPTDRLLLVQTYLGITAFTGFLLSAINEEFQSARKLLQDSETGYRNLVEQTDCLITNVDKDGRFTYVNEIGERIFGKAKEALVGMSAFQFIHPDDQSMTRDWFQDCIRRKLSQSSIENRQTNASTGAISHLLWTSNFKYDKFGDISEVSGISYDITKRKRAEEELLRLSKRNELILSSAAEGILGLDIRGNHTFVNPAAARMLGYEAEELLGRPSHSTWHHTKPDGSPYPKEECPIRAAYQDGVEHRVSTEVFWRKDGTSFPVEYVSTPIDEENRVVGVVVTFTDITERKRAEAALLESEERLDNLYRESPIPTFTWQKKGDDFILIDFNHAAIEISDGKVASHRGGSAAELYKDNPQILADMDFCFRERSFVRREVTSRHFAPSKHLSVHYGFVPQDLIIVHIEDQTDRKRAEEEKRSLQERLQRSEKMEALGQLAGGVAHDLNNILGVSTIYSELLQEQLPEGSTLRKYAESNLSAMQKAAAIIEDLLTLARRGVVVSEVINLNRVLFDFFKTPVFEKIKDFHPQVTFRIEPDQELLNTKGSAVHLEKVMMNLISNAADAISAKGVVTIRTENRYLDKPVGGYTTVREGEYAVLTVSDTGTGIAAENMGKIFEPFFTKKGMGRSGTGLGLSIVWGTVKDHDGYIDVKSAEGEGTLFTLYLPATREKTAENIAKIPVEQYMGRGEAVLVVDDVAEQRRVATTILSMLGYRVHAVASGEEAVEYLKENKVDILVLDMIMMPGIDGLETYRRVRAIHPKQKAIIVSGFSETDRVMEAQQLGAGAYVKKPYITEKIGIAVRAELDRT